MTKSKITGFIDRPLKPGFWARIARLFHRKPRSYREAVLRERPTAYYTLGDKNK